MSVECRLTINHERDLHGEFILGLLAWMQTVTISYKTMSGLCLRW
jgi:hypothetical protein